MGASIRPRARQDGVLLRELPDETLVYDLERHRAFCLNATAAAVFRRCDGRAAVPEIARRVARDLGASVDEEVVWLALKRLGRARLLREPVRRPGGSVSRRAAAFRIGGGVLLPLISSVLAPKAAEALTCAPVPGGAVCTQSQCGQLCDDCSGNEHCKRTPGNPVCKCQGGPIICPCPGSPLP